MKSLEARLEAIEEMISPTPSPPQRFSVTIHHVAAKPCQRVEERFDLVCRKVRGQVVTRKIEYPPVMAPENPEEFKEFMRQRKEKALKERNPDGE